MSDSQGKAATARTRESSLLSYQFGVHTKAGRRTALPFGSFENAGCRLADLADVRAIGLDTASYAAFAKNIRVDFIFEEFTEKSSAQFGLERTP